MYPQSRYFMIVLLFLKSETDFLCPPTYEKHHSLSRKTVRSSTIDCFPRKVVRMYLRRFDLQNKCAPKISYLSANTHMSRAVKYMN